MARRTQEANAADLCMSLGLTFLVVGAGCLAPSKTQIDDSTDKRVLAPGFSRIFIDSDNLFDLESWQVSSYGSFGSS